MIRTTTALLLEALGNLWDAYDEADHKPGEVTVVEISGWEAVAKGGGKKYFRPRFKSWVLSPVSKTVSTVKPTQPDK